MKIGRLLVRLVVGGLFIGHGTQKLFGWFDGPGPDGTEQVMYNLGMPWTRPRPRMRPRSAPTAEILESGRRAPPLTTIGARRLPIRGGDGLADRAVPAEVADFVVRWANREFNLLAED